MSVSLAKGGNVSLTKIAPSLTAVSVGLGWDVRTTTGAAFDLDASALVCGTNGKVIDDSHFVFFNNLKSPDGSVEHLGDNSAGFAGPVPQQCRGHHEAPGCERARCCISARR